MLATLNLQSVNLREEAYGDPRIDKAAGVIRGVKILGRHSANNREYSDSALDDAARLYEGARVCFDHDRQNPHRERAVMESIGVLKNTRRKGGDVFGDLHYLKAHPNAGLLLEYAERFPRSIGLSHNADGKGSRRGGKFIVESIGRINSVDLVLNPATNNGLFESTGGGYRSPTDWRRILEASEAPELGIEVANKSADVDMAVAASLNELIPWESLEQASRGVPRHLQQLAKSLSVIAAGSGATPSSIAKATKKILEWQEWSTGELKRILDSLADKSYTPPPAPGDEEPPTLESVKREIDKKMGRRVLQEAEPPLSAYPADSKEFARSLR
ncbi:MAG TPA: hypothetical protein VMP01_08950 [Pirellulaceae bacterium]|nr:hypothetical protein [Pirellulaceae bacterium]